MRYYLIIGAMLTLVGCQDRVSEVETKMQAIQNSPAQPVEQPPVFEAVESFSYGAEKIRSPFMPPSLVQMLAEQAKSGGPVMPDKSRTPEPLEDYELTQLTLHGVIVGLDGSVNALVADPSGNLNTVRVGNYIGKNSGRIVEIKPDAVNLIEIVPDGGRGYVERPRSLLAPGA